MRKTAALAFGACIIVLATLTQINASHEIRNYYDDAAFAWQETVHDFGKIKRNVPVSYKFTFRNSGDSPLIIASVNASCGCTVTDYSKDPVPGGGEGYVKATYNAANPGTFSKTVTVNANTGNPVLLTIKGIVEE